MAFANVLLIGKGMIARTASALGIARGTALATMSLASAHVSVVGPESRARLSDALMVALAMESVIVGSVSAVTAGRCAPLKNGCVGLTFFDMFRLLFERLPSAAGPRLLNLCS